MSLLKHQNNGGMTIVEVLVAGAIITTASVFIGDYAVNTKNALAKVRLKMEVLSLRNAIRSTVNCEKTLEGKIADDGHVTCGGSLALLNYAGHEIDPQVAGWELEASCDSTKITLNAQKKLNGVVVKDPLTKKELNYSNSVINPLFGAGSAYGLCESYFKSQKKIRVFHPSFAEVGRTSSECDDVNPTTPLNINTPAGTPADNEVRRRIRVFQSFSASCDQFCKDKIYIVGGYMAACDSSGVTCVCARS